MHTDLSIPMSDAGIISMIISGLFSDRIIHYFGTGKITVVSVTMVAIALLGLSVN